MHRPPALGGRCAGPCLAHVLKLICSPTLGAAGIYNCSDSTRPKWDCSPPTTNLTELAQGCLDDPQCLSIPIKQGACCAAGCRN